MAEVFRYRFIGSAAAFCAAAVMLSGCVGGPTYGTGKTASAQLADDLGSAVSLPSRKGADIAYEPRPGIVQPPDGDTTLPAPQESVASNDNPNWPESPEETRDRIVASIDAERGDKDPRNRSLRGSGNVLGGPPAAQQRQFRKALVVKKGKYRERRFLSDPPQAYRQPAESAPAGELGKSERVKQRERLAAAQKKKRSKWWPF